MAKDLVAVWKEKLRKIADEWNKANPGGSKASWAAPLNSCLEPLDAGKGEQETSPITNKRKRVEGPGDDDTPRPREYDKTKTAVPAVSGPCISAEMKASQCPIKASASSAASAKVPTKHPHDAVGAQPQEVIVQSSMIVALHGDSSHSDFRATQTYISSASRMRSPISATPAAAKEGIYVKPAPKTQAANNPTAISAVPAQPTPEEDSEISAAVLQRVTEILVYLDSSSPDSRPVEFGNVELATWYVLQNNYVKSLDCKLEYLYPEKLVIVTYPSGVHESFNILLKPIADLADHSFGSFIVDTNRDIRLPSWSSVTPDFAFGRNIKNSSPKYSNLFECAWTQSPTNLSTKVNKCLDHPDVDAVICFDIITSEKFQTPGSRPPADHDLAPAFSGPELERGSLKPDTATRRQTFSKSDTAQ
ncbi:hypothetical protein B0H14DRAFT_3867951 [Mycena olivaceomarginata]|nr:hypothetical protein B0H14DRAFT_3867951 [Mycena olivaceomarginata]